MIYFFLTFLAGLFSPLITFAADAQPGFVSLTDIPVFSGISGAVDLSTVLNGVYGLCIGIASVLAVGMLMWAGLEYMGGDSITEKKAARSKIAHALFGLLLVLSPAIVFGIIDQRILSLSIDTSSLTSTNGTTGTGSVLTEKNAPQGTWDSTASNAEIVCIDQGGTPTSSNGVTHCTAAANNCPVIGQGVTELTANEEACCPVSWACSLQKDAKGGTACSCTVDPDAVDPATLPGAATSTPDKNVIHTSGSSGTSWKYTGSSASECSTAITDGVNLTTSTIYDPADGHKLSLTEKEQCCVALLPISSCVVKSGFSIGTGADTGETCGCQ